MEVIINHLGALQFEIGARGHRIISDQPQGNGGFDEGMTPPEFLLASLGSCAAFYAVDFLKRNNLLVEGIKVRVTAEKNKGIIPGKPYTGARLDDFGIEVEIPSELSDKALQGLEEAVHRCLVHNTLLNPPRIKTAIHCAVKA